MKAMQYKLPNTAAEVDQLITRAVKAASSTRLLIQQAAVGILYHAYKHGDYTKAGVLVNSLKDTGVRRDSLVKYLSGFGGLLINEDKETKKEQPFCGWSGAEYIKDNFEDAKATMWDKVVEEKDPYVIADLNTMLAMVIKRMDVVTKRAQRPDFQGKVSFHVHENILLQLRNMMARDNIDTAKQDMQVTDKLGPLLDGKVIGDGAQDEVA